jgi:hypothetical protein
VLGVLGAVVACRDDVSPARVAGPASEAQVVSGPPNQQDWRHCENGRDPASVCDWTTGNLNATQNIYYEGWYVPHALRIPDIVGTAPDTLVMTYGFKKGGHHTFDFLGVWNASLANANVCSESRYAEFCTGPVNATTPPPMKAISASTPAGSLATALVAAAQSCGTSVADSLATAIARAEASGPAIALRGIGLSAISIAGASLDGCGSDVEATIRIVMTPAPGATSALLLIGAHIARTRDWLGGGATQVPGSPYHLGLVSINGISTGSMDLQLQSDAIVPTGRVIVIKRTLGDVGSFDFTRSGGASPNPIPASFSLSTGTPGAASSGADTVIFEDVPAGTQVISESAPTGGWQLTALACTDPSANTTVSLVERAVTLVVDDSEEIVCTFTNTAAGAIRVVKTAVGGDSTFSFTPTGFGSGAFALMTVSGAKDTTFSNVVPALASSGTYRLSETALSGWAAGTMSCLREDGTTSAGDPATGITVAAGETTTCAITNTKQATIVVKKVMVGGTGTFSFTEDVTGSISTNNGTLSESVAPGTYHATEDSMPGWDLTALTCDDTNSSGSLATRRATFEVAAGETVTCTFTNTKRGAIRMVKTAVGGDSTFSFTPTGFGSGVFALTTVSGTRDTTFSNVVPALASSGTYRLSETALSGWAAGTMSCLREDGTTSAGDPATGITVAAGETTTCAITNTKQGAIVVKKVMVGGTGTFGFTEDVTGSISTNNGTLTQAVAPGTYHATEDTISGWDLTALSCDDTNSSGSLATRRATFEVAAGETVTCTFTNTKRGAIRVVKTAVGGDSTFRFTPTGFGSGAFALTTVSGTKDTTFSNIVPALAVSGTYRLAEDSLAGWNSGTMSCLREDGTTSAGDPATGITVATGETTTCAITNTKQGAIVVKKVMVGGTGTFSFTEDVTGSISTNNGTLTQAVAPGTYHATEASMLGWELTALSCDDTNSSGSLATRRATFEVAAGETVTCTFTNTKQPEGTTTRTRGFWSQHQTLIQSFVFGPTGTPPAGYTLATTAFDLLPASVTACATPATRYWDPAYILGGLNANPARTSTGQRRSAIDQARMQLMRQLLAAVMNGIAFGSTPQGSVTLADAFAAYCGTDRSAILMAADALTRFNESGEMGAWMIGPMAPANEKLVTTAMIALWDVLP